MYYFTSTDILITLFGYLSSLDFNNRIENLTLMIKFRGAHIFGRGPLFGGGTEAVPLLPPSRAGPAYIYQCDYTGAVSPIPHYLFD